MPRTAIGSTALVLNGSIDEPAYTAIDAANGMSVDVSGDSWKAFLHVRTTSGAGTITIRGNTHGSDLVLATDASGNHIIGPIETYFYQQAGQVLHVDFSAGMTGTIRCYKLP